ncbi:MAG TPA: NADH-quinone oxidoreductase subunit N [Mycobacteriales bacterium]|jgi:NADH-quinone oxidoreductase subunit N|nr:NADH-quinone oxidoreductase subunit N [Mycobacteriales bacterium]
MLQSIDYHTILPELILGGTALLVLVVDLFLAPERKWLAMPLSLFGVLGALAATATFAGQVGGGGRGTFCAEGGGCSFVVDNFAVLFKVIFLVTAVIVLLLSLNYFEEGRYYQGEYYFLLLCSFFGMLTIASSRDLIMLFISLEIVSVPGFVIAGFRKTDTRSSESAIKFFLIGVLATAVMLFGMSLVYGLTGSLQLTTIAERLGADPRTPAALAAVGLVITGFAFKVSAAPFHFWAPDTYQGAPVPVAAFLSVASKAAGFTGLMAVCFIGFAPYADVWGPLLAVLAVITMSLGNLVAIQQRHMVRLLAYSSVAQAGYMLVPFGVASVASGHGALDDAFAATLAYIAIYSVMNLGVFACVIAVARRTPRNLVADYRGLVKTSPLLAVALAFFLFCLAGAPPGVAGLWAKLVVFRAAMNGHVVWLAAVMAVNTVIAAYYYLKLAFNLFAGIGEPAGEERLPAVRIPAPVVAAIGLTVVAAIVLSFWPNFAFDVTPRAVFALRP